MKTIELKLTSKESPYKTLRNLTLSYIYNLKNRNRKTVVLSIVFIILCVVALIFLFSRTDLSTEENKEFNAVVIPQEETPLINEVISYSTNSPSEDVPVFEYTVSADQPKSIRISSIGINGYIQRVDLDQYNQIAVPNNIHFTGWYVNSVKPGEKGLSIMDGHVDGPTSSGVFANLTNVSIGDTFEIEYGDGSIINFSIVDKIQVNAADAYNVLFAKRPGIYSQLNLITCGGIFNLSEGSYEDRIIVISEKI